MADPDRRYRNALHYLQYKTSALAVITQASRTLQTAHEGIASFNPSIPLLEQAADLIQIALREARGMANLDDATMTGKPAA